ncbi:hypothetical protein NC653_031970 [Populus alba x Populus x berolinensis]|uniref:Secreted protein n=1 Tax=Populus alba x Populus x berolinensis TaxID=444605 RepID=A0AAD6Q230_9ROSI|nr:hypothetical protein NC653_031970 [Populus alba x Populus x berolinensis]
MMILWLLLSWMRNSWTSPSQMLMVMTRIRLQNFSLNHLTKSCAIALRIFNLSLMFGTCVQSVMLLVKARVSRLSMELALQFGSVKPHLLFTILGG